jgi:4-alpha-glucanotransferase
MSGVSITSGGNIELQDILAGGDGFTARLKTFKDAAAQAEAAKQQLRAEAEAILERARETQAAADKQLADNQAAAEQLRLAQEEAEKARVNLPKSTKPSWRLPRPCPDD